MIRILQNLKSYQVFAALLLFNLVILAIQFESTSGESVGKRWLFSVASPAGNAVSTAIQSTGDYFYTLSSAGKIRDENVFLRKEIERLRFERVAMSQQLSRSARLERMINYLSAFPMEGNVTEITSRSFQVWDQSVTIRGGQRDGFSRDLPVLDPTGVVGRIRQCGPFYSLVSLITNGDFALSGIIPGKNIRGIVRGTNGPILKLDYVTLSSKVSPGDRIVTSGDDGIFPPDFPVGIVVDSHPAGTVFQEISVRPMADLGKIRHVFVLRRMEGGTQ